MNSFLHFNTRRSAASGRLKASRTRLRRLHGGKVVRTKFSAPAMAGQVRLRVVFVCSGICGVVLLLSVNNVSAFHHQITLTPPEITHPTSITLTRFVFQGADYLEGFKDDKRCFRCGGQGHWAAHCPFDAGTAPENLQVCVCFGVVCCCVLYTTRECS